MWGERRQPKKRSDRKREVGRKMEEETGRSGRKWPAKAVASGRERRGVALERGGGIKRGEAIERGPRKQEIGVSQNRGEEKFLEVCSGQRKRRRRSNWGGRSVSKREERR